MEPRHPGVLNPLTNEAGAGLMPDTGLASSPLPYYWSERANWRA